MEVSLDDLIQKDRQKAKTHKPHNNTFKTKKIAHNQPHPKPHPQQGFRGNPQQLLKQNKFNRRAQQQQPRQPEAPKFVKQENRPVPQKEKRQNQAPKQEKGRTLKVLGLHPDITNEDLYKLFAAEGALEKCMIEQDNFGRNLPCAIVKYHSADMAQQAIANLNSKKVLNSVLTVEPYRRTHD